MACRGTKPMKLGILGHPLISFHVSVNGTIEKPMFIEGRYQRDRLTFFTRMSVVFQCILVTCFHTVRTLLDLYEVSPARNACDDDLSMVPGKGSVLAVLVTFPRISELIYRQ
ncbi:hypothetical protein FRC14_003513 [Serendipita sp. 396]|nr:hypothetical protein FRC14_003513 [Serendipita sp. 396]KAG8775282.1 hypothetical protein FRC15_000660 [Serendipita sp. 397]KAG8792884.1 hypothetical protein FRC16_011228 [Serendipita sp. 398]KAG8831517.1 hypothetical protein FRC18_006408 [Serendipita sp. 400]KAG8863637.1 hypothetical protein FRC20_010646 [Serendipita sp. 405]